MLATVLKMFSRLLQVLVSSQVSLDLFGSDWIPYPTTKRITVARECDWLIAQPRPQ